MAISAKDKIDGNPRLKLGAIVWGKMRIGRKESSISYHLYGFNLRFINGLTCRIEYAVHA